MELLLNLPTHNLNDRMRVAAEMLLAGVAFQQDGKIWHVYSHAGDDFGTMSTFMVCETACMLKKLGFKSDNLRDYGGSVNPPDSKFRGVVTFGRNIHWVDAELDAMMERRVRNPQNLI